MSAKHTDEPQGRALPHRLDGGTNPDPMRMSDQPALQTSSGTIWIVFGALVVIATGLGLGFLAFAPEGRASAAVATGTIFVVVALYALLIVFRLTGTAGPSRLRRMAACFLGMLGIAVLGAIICSGIEWSMTRM